VRKGASLGQSSAIFPTRRTIEAPSGA
jgi:hypothetical protein